MKLLLAVLLSVALVAQAETPGENPKEYWSRGYVCSATRENYNIRLNVDELDEKMRKITAMMEAGGAPHSEGINSGGSQRVNERYMRFTVPVKNAQKLADRVKSMGEIINFQRSVQDGDELLRGLKERISIVEGEIRDPAVSSLPTAAFLLREKLAELKRRWDICAPGYEKGLITVQLKLAD